MHNIILGKKSSVTKSIINFTKNSTVISANNFNIDTLLSIIKKFSSVNIVFNNFYPSKFLNKLTYKDYEKFENLSLKKNIKILESLPKKKINKIIYTSSSAVYKIPSSLNNEKIDKYNRDLYSSFKLVSEKLISNYANKNKIKYYLLRLFNTYGNSNDEFSLIEKIIRSKNNNKKIPLINEGLSIRDFVHLNDVGKIYNIFLNKNIKNGIYEIGSGEGFLIKDLFQLVNIPKKNIIKIKQIEEIERSIANTEKLFKQIGFYKFKNLSSYLKKKCNLKNNKTLPILENVKKNKSNLFGIIIYGAGFAGKQISEELKKNNEDILCFVDDNIKKQNTMVNNIPVVSYSNILKIDKYQNAKRVYLTIPSLTKKKLYQLINKIKKNFFDVRYLPQKKFLISDQLNINDLSIDDINQILKRKQIKIKKIKKLYNKNILVTGAAGTIGSEICRQLVQHGVKKIIGLDHSELSIYSIQKKSNDKRIKYQLADINDFNLLKNIIKKEKIDIIFHAAAYKHLNILEKNIFAGVKNNIFATYNLCQLSYDCNCDLVFISTDKAASPKSILGYTKRIAEKICENFNTKLKKNSKISIVRFGNVFGSSGSAINNFFDQINSQSPINITDKRATRYFMTIMEACHLVLQTTEIKFNNKIFVLNMGKPVNIFQLAKNLARIKTRINPNYKFTYKEIGLNPGEKLHEKIFDKNEIKKKYNNEIYLIEKCKNALFNFNKYYSEIVNYYNTNNKKELYNSLKKITKY